MSSSDRQFYTVRGYALLGHDNYQLTPSMEDYLEMAYRLGHGKGFTRISDLAAALNVQPPSASKMVQKLAELDYLRYEKYGVVEFTARGLQRGVYLLERHNTIEEFLRMIGVKNNVLEDTEKLEHNISEETYRQISSLLESLKNTSK